MFQLIIRCQRLQQVQSAEISPLPVIDEYHQWVLRPGENSNEALESQIETVAGFRGTQGLNRRLLAYDQLQLRNHIDYDLPV